MSATPTDHRDVATAAVDAEIALRRYAELLRAWNDPDDEHTRYQLRAVLDEVLEEVLDA